MMETCYAIDSNVLAEIEETANQNGVEIELELTHDEGRPLIYLGRIERTDGIPGAGRRILNHLCEFADEAQIRVRLAVICWNTTLIEYYGSFGFEVIAVPSLDDHSDHAKMERQPT